MQILLRVKFYDARAMQGRHYMGLSNFERKKAGKLELEELSNFRSWKAGRCARKFEFLENLWYNKRLGVELGARVSLKAKGEFEIS